MTNCCGPNSTCNSPHASCDQEPTQYCCGCKACSSEQCCYYSTEQAIAWNNNHSCNFSLQFRMSDAQPNAFGSCCNLTVCHVGRTYQPQGGAPSFTTDRVCNNVTTYAGNQFPVEATISHLGPRMQPQRLEVLIGLHVRVGCADIDTSNRVCANVTNCSTRNNTWSLIPPPLTSNVRCNMTVSNCTLNVTYQTKAPTLTSDRKCTNVRECQSNLTYESALPTLTTDRTCTTVMQCNGSTPFQLRAPTYTTNRICTPDVWGGCTAMNGTYAAKNATPTSNAVCPNVTDCKPPTEYQLQQATNTSNTICVSTCPEGCHSVTDSTGYACSCISPATGLTTAQVAGVVVGCIVFFVLSGIAFISIGRWLSTRDRQRVEEAEMQLLSAREESAASEATVRRIMSAWKIPAEHVTFLHKLAEGTYGAVWKGLWGSQTVAVKVLKRAVDDDEHGNEDFRKECEALQAIKHPNLIVFFGAGITDDDKPFIVSFQTSHAVLRCYNRNDAHTCGRVCSLNCASCR